ncbi:hypothetical protein [Cupriavidus pampae]|uniref:hypothetical protein n=1 Tax=Cupriavidus pampae TaxID=659251 RepID=UPI001CC41330|nr:hypothetical protein [Cupriavidus pampae]
MINRSNKAEMLLREQLMKISTDLCSGIDQSPLGSAVRRLFPRLKKIFLIRWIPEQAEDIYWFVVSDSEIARIEIIRCDDFDENSVKMEILNVEEYSRQGLSREVRRKLALALELI